MTFLEFVDQHTFFCGVIAFLVCWTITDVVAHLSGTYQHFEEEMESEEE